MDTTTEFFDSEPLAHDGPALRERMEQDGFLFFRNRVPADAIQDLYDQIWALCIEQAWVDEQGNILVDPPITEGEDRF